MRSQFAPTRLGTHASSDPDTWDMDATDPWVNRKNGNDGTTSAGTPTPTQPTTPTNPTTPVCSSTSPEFCALSGILANQVAGGATTQPYLQDNGSPVVVPTHATSSGPSALFVLGLAVVGAVIYFFYRKHGGEKIV